MHRIAVFGIVLLTVCSAGLVGATANHTATVTLESSTTDYQSDSTYEFDLVVDNVSETVGSYDITVTASDGSVVTFESFAPASGSGDSFSTITDSNTTLTVTEFGASLSPTDDSVTLGTVTMATDADGSATLSPSVTTLTNENADDISAQTADVTVSVSSDTGVPPLPGKSNPPANTDGDPQLEDINGDGDTNIFDAIDLYNNRNSAVVQNNIDLFDFNNDNAVNLFDAIELYNEISA